LLPSPLLFLSFPPYYVHIISSRPVLEPLPSVYIEASKY
jgi:hypothetical protein